MTDDALLPQIQVHMVKKVFPLLLSYVFVTTQCWAISGGPNYGSGKVSSLGTYSGVIAGLTESDVTTPEPSIPGDTLPTPNTTTTTNSNAIGLFDLSIPSVGTATGGFLLFADGTVFGGTIDGSVDPNTNVIQGIVQGSFKLGSASLAATAIGKLTAKIGPVGQNSRVTAKLTGTSFLDVEFGEIDSTTLAPIVNRVITFSVSGFRQSTAPGAAVSALTPKG